MTGKVFSESNNIYQDQAKILFDYYKNAAEAIVAAEMAEEQNRADLVAGRLANEQKKKKAMPLFIVFFGVAVISLILGFVVFPAFFVLTAVGIGLGIKFLVDFSKAGKEIANYEQMLAECDERFRNIRRDYRVEKIGVTYVPVATRVPFEDKNFLIDHTGAIQDTEFNLTVLRQPDEFQESVQKLTESMDALPIVESNEETEEVNTAEYSTSIQNITLNDYVGNVDRQVRNVSYLLSDNDEVSVNIPVIAPNSEAASFIEEYTTNQPGQHPIIKVFDVSFDDKVQKFASLNALKDQLRNSDESDSSEYMKHLMQKLAESVQIFTKTKAASSSKLVAYTSSIFNLVLKSGYTHYSPALEAEEIERIRTMDFDYQTAVNEYTPFSLKESSKVKYDMFSGNWVAEDGSRTSMPFGMHQIDEEIFMPVIASLMQENRVERLRIYNGIEDQKRGYLERWSSETGNYFRDNRKTADELITHMREAYADYMRAYSMYKSLEETSGEMKKTGSAASGEVKEMDSQAEMIAGFEAQAAQCNKQQEDFSDFMDRIQESIDESTSEFAHIEYYEGSLRDTLPHETALSISCMHALDSRRKSLVAINPYIANCAELPPTPITSPDMMDHVHIDLNRQVNEEVGQAYAQSDANNAGYGYETSTEE